MNLKMLPFGSATTQAAALRKGQLSSVELLKAYLERVDRFNPALNALVVDDRKAALRRARAAEQLRRGWHNSYFAQLFWTGLATAPFLPSTVALVGPTSERLPVGMQIVGPEFADLSTIWLAGELAKLIGGFQPPPGY